ncbi:Flavin containing amine oxidoreductase [Nesidiocoris tenuis]|uniref:Flavin containing amine oxidoreductase n=1 Tax=Nesidiocoris tenuis TaxID=355587 RepID=A0ABN7AZN1_9HEMI|nr:Flavin containing amine oxidoreductase [Nesidiocoris tenuis]
MVNPCWDKPCVVIVGAGIAGLSAAQRLISCGITDVTVLEATDRPGGRIHSCWMGDNIVEVGADHIEGASISNGAYALAAIEGLFEHPVTPRLQTEGLAFTSAGDLICPFVTRAATYTFNAIIDKTRLLFKDRDNGADCGSLCDYVNKEIERNIALYPCKYRAHAAQVMISRLIDIKSRIGADLNDVSATYFGAKQELPGGDVRVRSGMVGILASSLRGMPDCNTIRYCKPVQKIAWSNTPGRPRARVFCHDGDKFCADYVILTQSLGVLKEKADKMFEPHLPKEKMDAIRAMGFGNVNHLYLEYNKPFWVWNEGNMLLAWNYDELTDGSCCWLTGIGSISEVPHSQQIIQLTVAGTRANHIESTDDTSLAEDVTRMYRQFLRNPSIPYPANVLKSKWKESPYFRGARSYFNLESTVHTQCELARPVPEGCGKEVPVLLFAGEHTAISDHGTVHGARATGIREAQRILELTKKLQGAPAVLEPRTVDEERARGCV